MNQGGGRAAVNDLPDCSKTSSMDTSSSASANFTSCSRSAACAHFSVATINGRYIIIGIELFHQADQTRKRYP